MHAAASAAAMAASRQRPPEPAPAPRRRDVELVEPRRRTAVFERPQEREHRDADDRPVRIGGDQHAPELAIALEAAHREVDRRGRELDRVLVQLRAQQRDHRLAIRARRFPDRRVALPAHPQRPQT